MSGTEWTDDEPGRGDGSRPLTLGAEPLDAHRAESGPAPNTVRISYSKANAQPPESAMAHAPSDQDENDPNQTSSSARTRPGSGILPLVLSWLSKIRLPSLGSERHEMILDAPRAASTATGETQAQPASRAPARSSPLALRRETRVGLAAVLSFVVIVTALLYNNGYLGGRRPTELAGNQPPPMAIHQPVDGTKPPESAENPKGTPTARNDGKPVEPAKGSPTPPKKVEEAQPPGPASRTRLLKDGDPGTGEPVLPPASKDDLPKATLLGNTTESPSTPPDSVDPKATPPPLPTKADDPLQLPGDPLATPAKKTEQPPAPAVRESPATEPKPDKVAEPPSMGDPPPMPDKKAEQEPAQPDPTPAASNTGPLAPPPVPEPPGAPPVVPPTSSEPANPPIGAKVESSAPVLTGQPPPLESVPTAAPGAPTPAAAPRPETVDSAATPVASTAGALGVGWVVIQSGGRRVVGAAPLVSSPADSDTSPAPARAVDNPRVADDPPVADQVEPVLHRVLPGENFWTISKLYYRSPRFYRALHAANEKQVPNIRELYVGTVLRIPPPEALDRSLIDPPARPASKADDPSATPVSRTSKRLDPADEADLALPSRPRPVRPTSDPEAARPPRRPTYTVKPFETLRSIARDTLNDPKRDKEIFNLNRDILEDPTTPIPAGTTLTLPEDATTGRRAR